MSYGPGRSRFLQGSLVGAGVCLVGVLLTTVALMLVFEVFIEAELGRLFVSYALVAIWFVVAAALGPGVFQVPLLVIGVLTSLLFVAGGSLAVSRVDDVTTPWAAAKVGATISVGHVLLMTTSFTLASQAVMDGFSATTRTFALAFGVFVVPAAFGAADGVITVLQAE